MAVRFGTDGIRGRYPSEVAEPVAYRLGRAVADVFNAPVFVGCDTRESSTSLVNAVLAGLRDGGATVVNLGVFTTPGVAVIAARRNGAGIVVSASHNPYYDNGLKVLAVGGAKLDDVTEAAVEAALRVAPEPTTLEFPEVEVDHSAKADYLDHLRDVVGTDLTGLSIVLDCANGAASAFAPGLFSAAGADVATLSAAPDGRNINDQCGSTHPERLQQAVLERGANLGLAFDGDADRLIAVDADGVLRDGDDLMVLFALDFAERGIRNEGVVVTSMSNLGLRRAMERAKIELIETAVGDRHVLLALEARNWCFGGEQSGHLIFRDLAPTGDGMLTGLLLADLVARRGPLKEQSQRAWTRVPQRLVNVARDRFDYDVANAIFNEFAARHGVDLDDVRLVIRPSGTEPVVRVMVESLDASFVENYCEAIVSTFSD
jgi:phosphoglucosamine mutase